MRISEIMTSKAVWVSSSSASRPLSANSISHSSRIRYDVRRKLWRKCASSSTNSTRFFIAVSLVIVLPLLYVRTDAEVLHEFHPLFFSIAVPQRDRGSTARRGGAGWRHTPAATPLWRAGQHASGSTRGLAALYSARSGTGSLPPVYRNSG